MLAGCLRGSACCASVLLLALNVAIWALVLRVSRSLPKAGESLGGAADAPGHRRSGGCGSASAGLPAGVLALRTLRWQGAEREYYIRLPTVYRGDVTFPLVIALHGAGNSALTQLLLDQLACVADRAPFIAVYPQGSDDNSCQFRAWNVPGSTVGAGPLGPTCVPDPEAGDGKTYATSESWNYCYQGFRSCTYRPDVPPGAANSTACYSTSCLDDMGFLASLLDALQGELCVDAARVYMLGYSMGGMSALWLAARPLARKLAAIVVISAAPFVGYNVRPDGEVPMLHLAGSEDETIPTGRWPFWPFRRNLSNWTWGGNWSWGSPVLPGNWSAYKAEWGPHDSAVGEDGWLYTRQWDLEDRWAEGLNCTSRHARPELVETIIPKQPTNFVCKGVCAGPHGALQLVSCTGYWHHADAQFYWGSSEGVLAWAFLSTFVKPLGGGPVDAPAGMSARPLGYEAAALDVCESLVHRRVRDLAPLGLAAFFLPGVPHAIALETTGLPLRVLSARSLALAACLAIVRCAASFRGRRAHGRRRPRAGEAAAPLLPRA